MIKLTFLHRSEVLASNEGMDSKLADIHFSMNNKKRLFICRMSETQTVLLIFAFTYIFHTLDAFEHLDIDLFI